MTEKSSNQMERDLESMQDAVKHPNQTVRAFLLPLMQYVISRCHDEKQRLVGFVNSGRFFCYGSF